MKGLLELAEKALAKVGTETFKLADVQTKPSSNGNVGFKVVTESGKTITFWKNNMDAVIEAIDADTFKVKVGVQITTEGGLIPADKVSSGNFWA